MISAVISPVPETTETAFQTLESEAFRYTHSPTTSGSPAVKDAVIPE